MGYDHPSDFGLSESEDIELKFLDYSEIVRMVKNIGNNLFWVNVHIIKLYI